MSKSIGRNLIIKKGGTKIAAIKTKTVAWNGEPVDVTSDDSAGFRELLSDAEGQEQIDLSFDGVTDNKILRDIAFATGTSKFLTDITIEWVDTLETISGDFKLVSYEEGGTFNDARTFTGSLQSSGAWTYTP